MFILLYYFSLVFIALYYLKPENEEVSKQRKINKPVKHKTPLNLWKMFLLFFGVVGQWCSRENGKLRTTGILEPTAKTVFLENGEKFFCLLWQLERFNIFSYMTVLWLYSEWALMETLNVVVSDGVYGLQWSWYFVIWLILLCSSETSICIFKKKKNKRKLYHYHQFENTGIIVKVFPQITQILDKKYSIFVRVKCSPSVTLSH